MATQIGKNEYFSYYANATNEERNEFKKWLQGVMRTEIVNLTFRKTEKTFPATRYSVSNMGRKQVTMKSIGLKGNGGK